MYMDIELFVELFVELFELEVGSDIMILIAQGERYIANHMPGTFNLNLPPCLDT